MRRILAMLSAAVMVASLAEAQQHRGGRGGAQPDASTARVFAGAVASYSAVAGAGAPTLVVDTETDGRMSFALGSYRVLSASGFAAEAGDRVEITAMQCASCPTGWVATQVVNVTRNLSVVLRGEDGTPSARQGRGRGRHGMRAAGSCTGPDVASAATYSGTVKSFVGGPGQGMPTLVLSTANGEVEIMLAPYRALRDADFSPTAGQQLEVQAAPAVRDGVEHLVALSLRDPATGFDLALHSKNCRRR